MGIEARHAYRFGYLQSEHWQNLRLEKLASQDAHCMFCGLRDLSNDVHHIHYPEKLTDAKPAHLRVLCRRHHKRVHELMDEIKPEDNYGKNEGTDFKIFRRISEIIDREMIRSGEKRFLDLKTLAMKPHRRPSKEMKSISWESAKPNYAHGDRRMQRHKEIFKAFRKAIYVMDLIKDDPEYFMALPESIQQEYLVRRAEWIDFMARVNGVELRSLTHR